MIMNKSEIGEIWYRGGNELVDDINKGKNVG